MSEHRYSGPEQSGICVCGHAWNDHHLGIVMNDEHPEPYLPQECEFYGFNETGGLDAEGKEHCFAYRDAGCMAVLSDERLELLKARLHKGWPPESVEILALIQQAQEAASLRQRLEEVEARWTEVGQHIDKAAIGYNHPQIKAVFHENRELKARASQAEAALAEMQKLLDDFEKYLGAGEPASHAVIRLDDVVAELQRRRSAPGQEKA